jgi:diguanylate cyclase (GGDEF)-like protein
MDFICAYAFQFSSVLVGLTVLALIVLTRPGLAEDRPALGWWIAGDLALVAHRLPPLLQPSALWPGLPGAADWPVAEMPALTGLLLVLGLCCHTKALARLCHRRLRRPATIALLTLLPAAVSATCLVLPPPLRPLPVAAAAAGLALADIWIIRRERATSPALRIMTGLDAGVALIALVYVAWTAAGWPHPAAPMPMAMPMPMPAYMPPMQALIVDFVSSIMLTFAMSVALHERQQGYFAGLSTQDQLTGALNRRGVVPLLEQALGRAGRPFSVALLDIDYFKRLNDQYGHATGDAVLTCFADAVARLCRAGDVLARWGGEEFLLLLPGTGADGAQRAVQRIQNALPAQLAGRVPCEVTFSAGIATAVAQEGPADTPDTLLARADKCLYVAKIRRNCVVSHGQDVGPALVADLAAAG